MPVRGLALFLLLTWAPPLAVRVEAQSRATRCEPPQARKKITVLVLDQKADTPGRAAERWRRALRHERQHFALEISALPVAENERVGGVESLLETGARSSAALVLAREDREWWVAVFAPRADESAGFPVPTATRLREKEVKQFLQSFAYYFSGDYVCALEGFGRLESKRGSRAGGGELNFWIGSALARAGQREQAALRFRQATAGGVESKALSGLALALLLLPRAPHDQSIARETLTLLEDAARGLRGTRGRYWAASQAALGRYWLSLSGAGSVEGLRRARDHFEQAEFSLTLSRDELDVASLHALMAMTELQLEQAGDRQQDHLQKALDHFTLARAIWKSRGAEAEAEAASQQIRKIRDMYSR